MSPDAALAATQIDQMMDEASRALESTRYFEAASIARRALLRARDTHDHDRLARICLPLQEARRQIRGLAVDAAARDGITIAEHADDLPGPLAAGCVLLQPPLIAADARTLRAVADRARVPLFVLTREPLTRSGLWPLAAVSRVTARVRIDPPRPLERVESRVTRDGFGPGDPIPLAWFEAAGEALGDAAIDLVDGGLHPQWRVEALIELVEAVPLHEKLYQALAAAARDADRVGPPDEPRLPRWDADDLLAP